MPKDSHRNPHPLAPTASAMNRLPVDRPSVREAQMGMVVKKPGGGKGYPEQATAAHRQGVMRMPGERMGARRRIEVRLPGPQSPEATMTQRNARTVRPVMGSKQNFWSQAAQKW